LGQDLILQLPLVHFCAGRVIGRGHERDGLPCQDFVVARHEGNVVSVALADGAGSKSHSEFGAKAAVTSVMRLITHDFSSLYDLAQADAKRVADHILEAVLKKIETVAQHHKVAIDQLASTLLFVALHNGKYLAGHIGDGVIVRKNQEGAFLFSEPDNGEYSNSTYFITDQHASLHFRIYSGQMQTSGSDGFMVMSDGAAESLFNRQTKLVSKAASQLMDWSVNTSRKQMDQVIRTNLMQSIRTKTTDDCSIGIACISVANQSAAISLDKV